MTQRPGSAACSGTLWFSVESPACRMARVIPAGLTRLIYLHRAGRPGRESSLRPAPTRPVHVRPSIMLLAGIGVTE